MARVVCKADDSGDVAISTADDIADYIALALESNFYVSLEQKTQCWVQVSKIEQDRIEYKATVMKYGQKSFKIIGEAKPRVAFYKGTDMGRHRDKVVKANSHLAITWELAE